MSSLLVLKRCRMTMKGSSPIENICQWLKLEAAERWLFCSRPPLEDGGMRRCRTPEPQQDDGVHIYVLGYFSGYRCLNWHKKTR